MRLSFVPCLTGLLLALGAAAPAHGSPIDDPHLGGIGFAGTTTDDLSALYWNPAALGLGIGNRFMLSLTGHMGTLKVQRAAIDPYSGQPGGARTFPAVSGQANTVPRTPISPGSFGAAAFNVGSRVTVALGWFWPFVQHHEFGPAADGTQPVRYQTVSTDLNTVAMSTAISVLIGRGLRVGLAPALLMSTGGLVVDRDTGAPSGSAGAARLCGETACGAENPAAAARYSIASGRAFSFTLGVGVHLNRPLWSMGLAWTSYPLGTREGIEIEVENTRIDPPPRAQAGPPLCPTGLDPCVSSRMVFRLPMTLVAGIDRHLSARWDLGVQVRWLHLATHESVAIRAVGPAGGSLRTAGLPDDLVLYRGLKDVFDVRLRTVIKLGERIDVAATVRGETAAVTDADLSAAAMGGQLIEPSLALRARLSTNFVVTAGYALSFMPTIDNSDSSRFDPTANAACEATGGHIDAEPCEKRQRGLAGPTAAGRYRAHTHGFGLSLTGAF